MDILFAGLVVVFVLATISVTGMLRAIRIAAERTAAATESLLELERSRQLHS
ncbi:hypothetical protein [Agromyces ramosus]|uniref:Uncharacterized protein n=1 Tax=Agromyces ramosus TaxID=33879 RepID=A0ABU0R981_9MICO|nr:hypothetical protein [Agromyces ramosus]MDQ0894633.1 hypothetical protein [Agromyces ramosus]